MSSSDFAALVKPGATGCLIVGKVASGEASNLPMLDRLLGDRRPVILSSGMSPLAETDAAAGRVQHAGAPLAVLQCTSAYPCPPERVGLNLIPFYRERYRSGVG